LLLACVGIYGVVSYLAAQRTKEIGVRMALGATRGDITRLFVRWAMVPAAIGLAAGTVVSLAANRLLRSQLYGVQPDDLRLYLASLLVLLAPLLVATLRPAIRAGKTEPMEALRTEWIQGHRMKDIKRGFARIHNLMTRQRHDVRFRDEPLELAIQLWSAERFPRRSCLPPLPLQEIRQADRRLIYETGIDLVFAGQYWLVVGNAITESPDHF
jgi:hypothetical protein